MTKVEDILRILGPQLSRSSGDPRQVVVMTCGIAGSGKSSLSKAITAALPNFERISIDLAIYAEHGLYAIDYPAERYQVYQDAACRRCDERLLDLLKHKSRDIVLDESFWSRERRKEVKQLSESAGARCVLVYLKAAGETLRRRLEARKAGARNADSAFEVTEDVLQSYLKGFEPPEGENEMVINVH